MASHGAIATTKRPTKRKTITRSCAVWTGNQTKTVRETTTLTFSIKLWGISVPGLAFGIWFDDTGMARRRIHSGHPNAYLNTLPMPTGDDLISERGKGSIRIFLKRFQTPSFFFPALISLQSDDWRAVRRQCGAHWEVATEDPPLLPRSCKTAKAPDMKA